MRYVGEDQNWSYEQDLFWGGLEGAERLMEKLVRDKDELEWKVDMALMYVSAVLTTDPMVMVTITLPGKFNPGVSMWVSSVYRSGPSVELKSLAVAEDLTNAIVDGKSLVLDDKAAELKNIIDRYVEE